jgi:hypothetical protein
MQIYVANIQFSSPPVTYEDTSPPISISGICGDDIICSSYTIIPAGCEVKAIYAAIEWMYYTTLTPELPSLSFTLRRNSKDTGFPACNVTSKTANISATTPVSPPTACPLPDAPIAFSAGDTVSYVLKSLPVGDPTNLVFLNTTLLCQ